VTRPSITRGRAVAAEIMDDFGRIDRPSTTTALNEDTGLLTPTTPTLIHRGPCRVRPVGDRSEQNPTFGHTALTVSRYDVWFPTDIPAIHVGDVVTVNCSDDEQLDEIRMRVVAIPARTHLTHRTLSCELVD
jgi:hypothetical protein